ncbi:bifunctional metallophosphatase/5'-nucleotidase [uncultured Lactobacillus sp.]|uniref:bifunctional metallophosphatase/5'-nucleotidase n=1 Tax=uncultured Lactobacillus sp. TaxID=153152 RepID=UPI002664FF0B|nr:bifunctional metallophosphatase/5'-nucleotidase [uncultured Lactobacillus sp.]
MDKSNLKKELAALLLAAAVLVPGQVSASKLKVISVSDNASKPAQSKDWKKAKKYSKDIPVQFLSINDLHGNLSTTGTAAIGQKTYSNAGTVARLAAYLNQAQKDFKRQNKRGTTFRVESGDMVGASPASSSLLQDESTMHALKAMKFTLGTLGNHEFDEGLGEFNRILLGKKPTKKYNAAEMAYPHQKSGLKIIVANVIRKSTGKTPYGWKPYAVKTVKAGKKQAKVGFIGILTTEMPTLTTKKNYGPFKYLDEAKTIAKYEKVLRKKGVKAIVVLAHKGVETAADSKGKMTTSGDSVNILKKLNKIDPKNSVDLMIAGHSHQYANAKVGKTHLVQALKYGQAYTDSIGYINPKTKDFAKGSLVSHVYPVLSAADDPKTAPNKTVAKIVADADKRVAAITNQKIATAKSAETITGRENNNDSYENPVGDLVVDAQLSEANRQGFKVDFAMTNGGGVRSGLAVNADKSITYGAAMVVQPFGNSLQVLTMTGKQIMAAINQQYQLDGHYYLLFSGLHYVYTKDAAGKVKVVKVYVGNGDKTELSLNKTYRVVVNDFLAGGGDHFSQFTLGKKVGILTGTDTETFVSYLKRQAASGKEIASPALNRKVEITAEQAAALEK